MNRATYYRLRHNIRASGFHWNWGSRFREKGSLSSSPAKSPEMQLVMSTLLNPQNYDRPKDMDLLSDSSDFKYLRLFNEWRWGKVRGRKDRTRVWWQNFIRSNVRNDRALFTGQLTTW
jgi:hypothetical protein